VRPNITIAIPCFNNANTIRASIESALDQNYPLKEIMVVDDGSTDDTVKIASEYPVRIVVNPENLGIGLNLANCMDQARGKYIVYLCGDDIFADKNVVSDVAKVFNNKSDIGVIGRYFYFFMDGKGPIGVCRENNILISSCCPSGMAFRIIPNITGTNKIFIEMPSIVAQYLEQWRWTMFEYDTIGARYHPGGNTGTKTSYYTESPTQNWIDLLGDNYKDFPVFITLKNRAPKLLWREICLHIRMDVKVLLCGGFWLNALVAVLIPSTVLKAMTLFYRNRISRLNAKIIKRGNYEENGFHPFLK